MGEIREIRHESARPVPGGSGTGGVRGVGPWGPGGGNLSRITEADIYEGADPFLDPKGREVEVVGIDVRPSACCGHSRRAVRFRYLNDQEPGMILPIGTFMQVFRKPAEGNGHAGK